LTTAALGVGDGFVDGQGSALGPCALEVLLAHCILQLGDGRVVAGLVNHEADHAHALPHGFCRSEEPRSFVVTTGGSDQIG
jgi:hypothetical protein